ALSEAEGREAAVMAEVKALEKLLARDSDAATQLVDQVEVAPGFEAALGASLGDDLRAGEAEAGSGWVTLADYPEAATPAGAPISDHVKAPPLLARRLAQVAIVDRDAGDAAQVNLLPGQRLVSREGDLWRWDGYRIRAEDHSSGSAHRLAQRNRLVAQKDALAEASHLREVADTAYGAARSALAEASSQEQSCRAARRAADQSLADAARQLSSTEAELAMRRGKLETQEAALAARRDELSTVEAAVVEAEAAASDLGDVTAARADVERQRGEVDLARTGMMAARSRADELRREGLARQKRQADIARERAGWIDRRDNAAARIAEMTDRATETEAALAAARSRPGELGAKRTKLAGETDQAEARRSQASDALAVAEAALREADRVEREAEREASDRREARARAETVLEAARARTADAASLIVSELDAEPEALPDAAGFAVDEATTLPQADTAVTKLRRQRDALGSVNLRAEEDAQEVAAERDTLAAEKADLDAAVAKLRGGIAELNREGRARITTAFEQVNEKFSRLFRHLFGGGEARLVMVESEDPLDAGLEILCQPPGKKLSTLSLLSGGEQTLTALSLIFAVFLCNPAPICVLDEVDAPLDDSNVARFCDLLDEMVRLTETRFLIIT
ncbi:MAG: chromosome segregation protein SMC, partial [Pseudomonadota bacterium]